MKDSFHKNSGVFDPNFYRSLIQRQKISHNLNQMKRQPKRSRTKRRQKCFSKLIEEQACPIKRTVYIQKFH